MKNRDIFKTYFQQQELQAITAEKVSRMKTQIFSHTTDNEKSKYNQEFLSRKRIVTFFSKPVFVAVSIIVVFISSLSVVYFRKMHPSISLVTPVSAEELITNIEKKLGERFSYRITGYSWCNVNEDMTDIPEQNIYIRKMHNECVKNNGKLYFKEKVWVDSTRNLRKKEYIPQEWELDTVELDKKGNIMTGKNNVVTIEKNDKEYIFMALSKTENGNKPEGVFVEYDKHKPSTATEFNQQFTQSTGRDIVLERLQEAKKDPHIKVEMAEVKEQEQAFYKLSFSSRKLVYDEKTKQDLVTNEWLLFQEQYFEKGSYRPVKSISYKQGENGPFIREEAVYGEFNTAVDDSIFSTQTPPAGYEFAQGTVSAFDIIPQLCEAVSCSYGAPINYRINVLTYKNKNGTEFEYPFDVQSGNILNYFNMKIYESEQRFNSAAEAKAAQRVAFVELSPAGKVLDSNNFLYKSNGKIGEKPFSLIKIETKNKGTSTVEAISVAEIPYEEKKLSDMDKLQFKYIHKDSVNQNGTCAKAYYVSKKYPHTSIIISKAPIGDTCSMFWTNGQSPQIMGEFQQVKNYFNGENKKLLTEASIQFKTLGAHIQFQQTEQCGNLVTMDFSDKNTEKIFISCQEEQFPAKEKEFIIEETKKLLQQVEQEWN